MSLTVWSRDWITTHFVCKIVIFLKNGKKFYLILLTHEVTRISLNLVLI